MNTSLLGLLGFLVILLASSLAYSVEDCKSIVNDIARIEQNSTMASLTSYAYYAKLGDKYSQLAECYQDTNRPYQSYYIKAGEYYKKASENYIADFKRKYEYLLSAGEAYFHGGNREKAMACFNSAKEIVKNHPELNVSMSYIEERINELLKDVEKKEEVTQNNFVPVAIGTVVFVAVILIMYNITRKY